MASFQPLIGLIAFYGFAWLLSEDRRHISWSRLAIGLALQVATAALLLGVPGATDLLTPLNELVRALDAATRQGTTFIFGYLGGGDPPFAVTAPNNLTVVAFRILPMILTVSALSALLYYWGILPFVIRQLARLLQRTLGLSGPLSFGAAGTLVFGTIEAPMLIRPCLPDMSRAELFALFACTMATIAGTVMMLYAQVMDPILPDAMAHMVIASLISIPAAINFAHLLIPEPPRTGEAQPIIRSEAGGAIDALIRGTEEGLRAILSICAVIIVLFACVALIDQALSLVGADDLATLVGTLLRPVMWLAGVAWSETAVAARFMATKIVLNEFVAYLELAQSQGAGLSSESTRLLTYAMCGFANFGSVGIIIGGMSTMVPERRADIIALATKSIIAGNLATLTTACIVQLIG